ncbi:hypothetical protein [Corynebacterium terpenotabidum]|uniref:Uncharacterized protein n=1 Tax=Corynebacterium terpenotabidum Y-11 TaxID=1200352 RepID=S4XBY4_9CORY|nr:hypothetical protein [Corynebacterium terpenotabidum]AGP30101.1 hypothetical protein A606_02240 [Corynebacterium terpenotabidum Y-11]
MSLVRIIANTTEGREEVIEHPYSGTVSLRQIVRDVTGEELDIEAQWEFGLGKLLGDHYRNTGEFSSVEVLMLTDEMVAKESE